MRETEPMDEEAPMASRSQQQPLMASPRSTAKLAKDVEGLKETCTILSHQLTMIMGALRVPRCQCETCGMCVSRQQQERLQPPPQALISATLPIHTTNGIEKIKDVKEETHHHFTPSENGSSTSTEGEVAPKEAKEAPIIVPDDLTKPCQSDELSSASQLLSTLFPGVLQNISSNPFLGEIGGLKTPILPPQNHGGRKSKYCTPEEKKKVAEYASVHGAANAARMFGIPPSVAAYYQRKMAKSKHQSDIHGLAAAAMLPMAAGIPGMSPHFNGPAPLNLQESPMKEPDTITTANGDEIILNATPNPTDDVFKIETPSTPTTPSFLRGRGRGRPKLIGDELDASLVDYMVAVKQANPRGHLSASNALDLARDFILQRAPGLLEEHGGNIKLKLTWAMKLVSRVAERQKEMELGLPAGTLSNMGRAGLQQLNGVNGNLITDMAMAQNILSQLSQMQNEDGTVDMEDDDGEGDPIKITNVKELSLEGLGWKMEDLKSGDVSEDGDKEEAHSATSPDETSENGISSIDTSRSHLISC